MTGLFATLILCDVCGHGVDNHNPGGCTHVACACLLTRNGVIDAAIAIEVRESTSRFQRTESGKKASGF